MTDTTGRLAQAAVGWLTAQKEGKMSDKGCCRCDFLEVSGIVRTLYTCRLTGKEIDDIGDPDDCPCDEYDDYGPELGGDR
jgi:hypothetical protein